MAKSSRQEDQEEQERQARLQELHRKIEEKKQRQADQKREPQSNQEPQLNSGSLTPLFPNQNSSNVTTPSIRSDGTKLVTRDRLLENLTEPHALKALQQQHDNLSESLTTSTAEEALQQLRHEYHHLRQFAKQEIWNTIQHEAQRIGVTLHSLPELVQLWNQDDSPASRARLIQVLFHSFQDAHQASRQAAATNPKLSPWILRRQEQYMKENGLKYSTSSDMESKHAKRKRKLNNNHRNDDNEEGDNNDDNDSDVGYVYNVIHQELRRIQNHVAFGGRGSKRHQDRTTTTSHKRQKLAPVTDTTNLRFPQQQQQQQQQQKRQRRQQEGLADTDILTMVAADTKQPPPIQGTINYQDDNKVIKLPPQPARRSPRLKQLMKKNAKEEHQGKAEPQECCNENGQEQQDPTPETTNVQTEPEKEQFLSIEHTRALMMEQPPGFVVAACVGVFLYLMHHGAQSFRVWLGLSNI